MSSMLNMFFFFNLQVLLQAFSGPFYYRGQFLAEGGYSCTAIPYCLGFWGLFVRLKLIILSIGFSERSYIHMPEFSFDL